MSDQSCRPNIWNLSKVKNQNLELILLPEFISLLLVIFEWRNPTVISKGNITARVIEKRLFQYGGRRRTVWISFEVRGEPFALLGGDPREAIFLVVAVSSNKVVSCLSLTSVGKYWREASLSGCLAEVNLDFVIYWCVIITRRFITKLQTLFLFIGTTNSKIALSHF